MCFAASVVVIGSAIAVATWVECLVKDSCLPVCNQSVTNRSLEEDLPPFPMSFASREELWSRRAGLSRVFLEGPALGLETDAGYGLVSSPDLATWGLGAGTAAHCFFGRQMWYMLSPLSWCAPHSTISGG